MPPNPSEDIRASEDRIVENLDEDDVENVVMKKDNTVRRSERRAQQDELGPRERRQRGGTRAGL